MFLWQYGTEFILILLSFFIAVTSTKRLAAILKISVLLYSQLNMSNSEAAEAFRGALLYMVKIKRFYVVHEPNENV